MRVAGRPPETDPEDTAPIVAGHRGPDGPTGPDETPEKGSDEVATRFPKQVPKRFPEHRPTAPGTTGATGTSDASGVSGGALLAEAEAGRFRERWREVQTGFVDDPSEAVRQADELAAEVVNAIGQALTARKHELDERWRTEKDGPSDTERLRQALRAYRTLVDRMLTT
ncbi:hypothetical protein [Actinomadura rupiterrae]|uniref:hypothetical protein n=1 Tax=Actinomadura rupiterrae TaxID=559627 RepID=UPI0020A41019|nr:hypothetical protein [Actinomadura rupiterrae]MCP2342358.1 hypothetical protein [Actinomadura rupiterrae]